MEFSKDYITNWALPNIEFDNFQLQNSVVSTVSGEYAKS
jgi:hypothetical protein